MPVADVTSAFTSVSISVVAALAIAYAADPALRRWLSGRHGLVDWITLGALVGALIAGIWAARRSPGDSRFPILIPALAAWGVLDEMRYLAGALGTSGFVVDGVRIRSLDDFGTLFSIWGERVGMTWYHAALIVGLVGALTVVAIARTRRWADTRVLVTEHRVVGFIIASVGLTLIAPLVGFFGASAAAAFAANLVELMGAMFLVVAGLAAGDHRRTVAGWRRRLWPWLEDGQASRGPMAPIGR